MSEMIGPDCGVTILGRSGMRYREGSDTVFVDGEMLTGAFDFVVYASSINEWEGSHRPISDSEREAIIKKIQSTCSQNGVRIDVG